MSLTTLGILHPGAMGVTVAASAATSGLRVLWASEQRSDATAKRAATARLEDAGSLSGIAERSDILVSVCPPHAAEALAAALAGTGFDKVFVDANAVAPQRAIAIKEMVEAAGARYVDGGIVGPPARQPGTTRLYLSGADATQVASCFNAGPIEAIVIGDGPSAASALKMAYAAYTKGTTALLTGILGVARANGVGDALLGEWRRSQPDLAERAEARVRAGAPKAWRFAGEMEEIAATFEAAGLPPGFHLAAATLYERLATYRDADPAPELHTILDAIQQG